MCEADFKADFKFVKRNVGELYHVKFNGVAIIDGQPVVVVSIRKGVYKYFITHRIMGELKEKVGDYKEENEIWTIVPDGGDSCN